MTALSRHAAYQDHLRGIVAEYGWAVQAVMGDTPLEAFCYTVGLAARGLPELWIGSISPQQGTLMLNDFAAMAVSDGAFAAGVESRGQSDFSMPLRFGAPVRYEVAEAFMAAALQPDVAITVQQVLWPDPDGRFPGEDGYDQDAWPQRVLA